MSAEPQSWQGIDFTEDFSRVVANANEMMSDILQQYGTASMKGFNAVTETFVVVRWPWIVLPATVVLAGLATFALIVRDTRKVNAPKWSSSLFPLLYRHVDVDENHLKARGCHELQPDGVSASGSNLISHFGLQADATRFCFEKAVSDYELWQLRSIEVVHKPPQKRLWHKLKAW